MTLTRRCNVLQFSYCDCFLLFSSPLFLLIFDLFFAVSVFFEDLFDVVEFIFQILRITECFGSVCVSFDDPSFCFVGVIGFSFDRDVSVRFLIVYVELDNNLNRNNSLKS